MHIELGWGANRIVWINSLWVHAHMKNKHAYTCNMHKGGRVRHGVDMDRVSSSRKAMTLCAFPYVKPYICAQNI